MDGFQGIIKHSGWIVSLLLILAGLLLIMFRKQRRDGPISIQREINIDPQTSGASPASACRKTEDWISPSDIPNSIKQYQPLIDSLGESFDLGSLYQLAREKNLPHPHLTISSLQYAGVLVPAGNGCFCWKPLSG